jgi:hypothetical protein
VISHKRWFLREKQRPASFLDLGAFLLIEKAASMATNHASTRTTQLYDRRRDETPLPPFLVLP